MPARPGPAGMAGDERTGELRWQLNGTGLDCRRKLPGNYSPKVGLQRAMSDALKRSPVMMAGANGNQDVSEHSVVCCAEHRHKLNWEDMVGRTVFTCWFTSGWEVSPVGGWGTGI